MIKKILVPLDGSKSAEKALSYTEALAENFEAELILCRVVEPMLVVYDYDETVFYGPDVSQEEFEDNAYLSRVKDELRESPISVRTAVLEGHPPAKAIIDLACQESVDLIVMCTHGHSGLNRWVNGSVANKVMQHAPCPVFLVRAQESEC